MDQGRFSQTATNKFSWITVYTSLSQPTTVHCFFFFFLSVSCKLQHFLRNLPKYILWARNIYSKLLNKYLTSILIMVDTGQCFLSWLNSGSCLQKLRGEAHFARHIGCLPDSHPVSTSQHSQSLPLTIGPENGSLWSLKLQCKHRQRETGGEAQEGSHRKGCLLTVSVFGSGT